MANLPYLLLRPFVTAGLKLFYRKITVTGKPDLIPQHTPVILVANHQNALIDPLVIAIHHKGHINFMARASAFRNPLAAYLLNSLHMIPVFRPRDNVNVREANAPVFQASLQRLMRNEAIGIFPEGDHHGRRLLRPVRKGFARLAWMALEHNCDPLIVPVGIDFSSHWETHSRVILHYGQPFRASEIKRDSGSEETGFVNALSEKVGKELRALMLEIAHPEADRILWKLDHHRIAEEQLSDLDDRKSFARRLSECSDDELLLLRNTLEKYAHHLRITGQSELSLRQMKGFRPVCILSLLGKWSLIPLHLILNLIEKRVLEDEQFTATIKFVLRLIGLPLYWLLLVVLPYSLLPVAPASVLIAVLCVSQWTRWHTRRTGRSCSPISSDQKEAALAAREDLLRLLPLD